jgi:hypothetical protein
MRRRLLVFVIAALLPACSSCREDHPYVPYSIGDGDGGGAAASEQDAGVAATEDDAGGPPFTERAAEVAPANATTWTVDGIALAAPPGKIFALGLVADFDGDGARDAICVVRTPDKPELAGDVVFYRGRADVEGAVGPPRPIAAPAELTNDQAALRDTTQACVATQRLGQVGKHSAFVEIGVGCAKKSAPSRWIAVTTGDHVHLGAVLYDPKGAGALTIAADGSDADHDGIDDVALRVTLDGGGAPFDPGPKVSATLKWLDRPAGLSPDAAATEASFAQLASQAMARSVRVKEATQVVALVEQVRALFRAICPEAGSPRIKDGTPAGPGSKKNQTTGAGASLLACGQSHALEDVSFAEVRALVTAGDPLHAIAAFDRAQKPPATHTQARLNDATVWLMQATPPIAAHATRPIAAVPTVPRRGGATPQWGPLAFESSGKLLVRTAAGVVRVDPDLGDEVAADDVAAWPSSVVSPDGSLQWIEAYNPCDGFALRATLAPMGDEGQMRDVPLPIAPPLGTKCASKGEPAAATPIAWGGRGLEAIVLGEPVLFAPDLARAKSLAPLLDQPGAPGGPRSPDGTKTVFATSQGLLVHGAKWRLYRAPELDGTYAAQQACVVSNDATHVACMRAGKAWVGAWEENK